MKISDYLYDLPEENIAIYPPKVRGKAKLLVVKKKSGETIHLNYENILDFLNPGDLLILNDTKVINARLDAKKSTGGKVELIILENHGEKSRKNLVMYRGKLKQDDLLRIGDYEFIVKEVFENGLAKLSEEADLNEISKNLGEIPIPPYLGRKSEEIDQERYQTKFAKHHGSIAAPTASLNLTPELIKKLENKGVIIRYITLHVGLGTFLPIRTDDIEDHKMHKEFYIIPKETIDAIQLAKNNKKKVTALGTTVTRALEHAGEKILSKDFPLISDEADIFIYPGYKFKIINQLITNFHAPKTTVLMLVSAFLGWDKLKQCYLRALENDYKFLSYGDSMMIIED